MAGGFRPGSGRKRSPEPKDKTLPVRVSSRALADYRRAAEKEGLTLAQWVEKKLAFDLSSSKRAAYCFHCGSSLHCLSCKEPEE